jgi:hypothetical protein
MLIWFSQKKKKNWLNIHAREKYKTAVLSNARNCRKMKKKICQVVSPNF